MKGETLGNGQRVVSAALDCDGDTVLLRVDQTGVACHTGARSCFDERTRCRSWWWNDWWWNDCSRPGD